MFRGVITLALFMSLALATPAEAAETATGGNRADPCFSGSTGLATNAISGPTQSPAGQTMVRTPDPRQAPPDTSLEVDLPIVSESTLTWVEGGLTHTRRTIVREGFPKGTSSSNAGSHLAAPLSGVCTYAGQTVIDQPHTVCGGGCITQWIRRTANRYNNPSCPCVYYDRIEVRVWWERQGSTYINFGGSAYTEWREGTAIDCDGANQGRTTWNSFAPQWANDWQTYQYYWDETWLPTVSAPDLWTLYVFTQTPTNYFGNLYTQLFLD